MSSYRCQITVHETVNLMFIHTPVSLRLPLPAVQEYSIPIERWLYSLREWKCAYSVHDTLRHIIALVNATK